MTTIRLMERRDIPACMALAAHGWGPLFGGMSHVDFNEAFGPGWRPTFYVADVGGDAAAMCAYNIAWLGYGIYSLTWLVVHPVYRKCNLASALVDRCLADLRPLARVILAETPSPIVRGLLERRGFEPWRSIAGERGGEPEMLLGWTGPREATP